MNWPSLNLGADGATLVISPSQLSLMQRCQRQWGYKYLYNREPARDGVSAGAGKAFHSALEVRNKARGKVTPDVVQAMHDALVKAFADVQVPEDDYRTLGRFQRVVDAYNEHWRDEALTTLGVEIPIMVELGTITTHAGKRVNVVLKAIVDRLVKVHSSGLILVADTKTTKDWRDSNQVMWQRAAAPMAYTWGLMQLAKREPTLNLPPVVHGFLLDSVVVRREASTLKRPRKNDVPDQTFQRFVFSYTTEMLEEWRRNAMFRIKSLLEDLEEHGDLPHNESSCSNFYGRTCPYLDVCRESAAKRPLLLSFDNFQDRKPSPFERVGEAVESETGE